MELKPQPYIYDSKKAYIINSDLSEFILSLPENKLIRRSHFFHGRYENLYIERTMHQGLLLIIEEAMSVAAELLQRPEESLQLGFWLNIMNRGDITTLHSHDDDDELLSAVYYVQVPEQSGLFELHANAEIRSIKPVSGRYMFFDPALLHEVGKHMSDIPRISIGMNFGPADTE